MTYSAEGNARRAPLERKSRMAEIAAPFPCVFVNRAQLTMNFSDSEHATTVETRYGVSTPREKENLVTSTSAVFCAIRAASAPNLFAVNAPQYT